MNELFPLNQREMGEWSVEDIRKRRRIYLVVFLLMVLGNIAGAILKSQLGAEFIIGVNFVIGIIFLVLFINVAKTALGYSGGTLAGMSLVILFIPFFSLLTIAIVDRKVYQAIREKKIPSGTVGRQISSLAIFSLVLFLFPYVGLPMAICAVWKISKSEGQLYGKTLAWISVAVNAFALAMMIFATSRFHGSK